MNTVQKKICLLGDFAVGKTSLVRQFVEGRFDDKYHSTIGVKISRKPVMLSHKKVDLLVWDVAGSNGFDSVTKPSYMQGAAGAIIAADLTRRETLAAFEVYASKIRLINPAISLVFVFNKVDLTNERVIPDSELQALSAKLGDGTFLLTSAKTGEQVDAAFSRLADIIISTKK